MNAMSDPLARVAASKRAMARAARERAAMAIAGTPGGAMEARATRVVETIQAGVRAAEVEGADPFKAATWTARQHNAGCYLRDLWRDALPVIQMPGGYGTRAGHGGERHLSHDEYLAAERAWQDYRKAMDDLDSRAGVAHGNAVRAMVLNCEAAPLRLVADGLDVLAGHWRMR